MKDRDLNASIGAIIKFRRRQIGMTQTELADHLGVTFQQIQKYEKGSSRVSAVTLKKISKLLNHDMSEFFDSSNDAGSSKLKVAENNEAKPFSTSNMMQDKNLAELIRVYYSITDEKVKEAAVDLVRSMSKKLGS